MRKLGKRRQPHVIALLKDEYEVEVKRLNDLLK